MTHQELRQRFISFSESKGHKLFPAAPLVPDSGDPTVLFTVAGMQQFKPFYQHPEDAPADRVVTIQPCIRTIDIDEVGDDTHLTVFEMMGHFSFGYTGEAKPDGPYFKRESIHFGWEFLTKELGIESHRIYATYFAGDGGSRPADEESRDILKTIEGLSRVEGTDENFWGPVGAEGPCGPNVEFYVDGVEVWNSVFNQYEKIAEGAYQPLEYQGVDMGTGFERMLAVVQGKANVYETDLLASFVSYVEQESANYNETYARIIVDHTKASLYLLCNGVKPGNKGRDYVLRRLIRRAVRASQMVGFQEIDQLLQILADMYGAFTPQIAESHAQAIDLFKAEKDKFIRTLQAGINQIEKIIGGESHGEISGSEAFKLLDTYGFPLELTQEIAHEKGWTVDITGFEEEFAKHREKSRAGIEKMFQGGLADHSTETVAHHTAHHLLLAALRQVLGDHVVQRGSNITQERLRIDVTHPEKITDDQLRMVEAMVNQKIEEDLPVLQQTMDRDEALSLGALAEFGAKYPKEACVYTIVDQDGEVFSREFCGGPHVSYTGELGRFEILKEEASGAGIRRIRARVVRS